MNRSIKRILSIALALCLVLSFAGTAFAEEPPAATEDIIIEQPTDGTGGVAPAPAPEDQPQDGTGDMVLPDEVEVIEEDVVGSGDEISAMSAVSLDELLTIAAQDGAKAAEILNAMLDDALFEQMLTEVLKVYYSSDLKDQLAAFLSAIDQRAMPIIANFDAATLQRSSSENDLGFVPGEVLVVFNTAQANVMGEAMERHDAELVRTVDTPADDVVAVVNIPLDQTVEQAVEELAADPTVEYVQPNYIYERTAEEANVVEPSAALNDEYASNLWHLDKINASAARDIVDSLGSRSKVRVAVIDDRTDITHPDLAANINASISADVYTGVVQPYPTSGFEEHGTHVAGIIGAVTNNNIGVAGTGSGSRNQVVEMFAVNIYPPVGNANTVSMIAGINYALTQNARVINVSHGYLTKGSSYDGLLKDCVDSAVGKGAVVVCSAGNSGTDAQFYPGDIESTINVIATTNYSSTSDNSRASYSNYGSAKDISAPGSGIYSTVPGSSYKSKNGTSMASPIVAGVAAMVLYANPSLTPAQVKTILTETATDLYTPGFDTQTGWGNVNAQAALERVTGSVSRLSAPANIVAKGNGTDTITLTWDSVAGAAGYDVSRSTSFDGTYSAMVSIPSNGSASYSYTNVELDKSTTYYYKVIAYTGSGSSKQSGFTGGPVAQTAGYPAPSGFTAASTGKASIKLSWTKEDDMNGYTIYRSDSSAGSYSQIKSISGNTTTTYTDTGLSTGKTYYYKISAYKTVGGSNVESVSSAAVSAVTQSDITPVTGLKATSSGYNSATLEWATSTGVTGYYIYRSTSASGTYTRVGTSASANETLFADTGLSTGKAYYYKVVSYVTATTDVDLSGATAMSVTPVNAAVTGIKAQSTSYDTIKISWGKSAGASGYDVYRSTSSSSGFSRIITLSGANTLYYKDTGRTTGTTYYYRVIPFRSMSAGKIEGGMASVSGKSLVAAPKNFAAKGMSTNSIQLTWGKPAGATGYMIYRATAKSGPYTSIKTLTSGNTLSYTNTGLAKGTKYYYKIRPYRTVSGSKIAGTTGGPVAGQTKSTSTAPTNLVAKTTSYNEVTLNWDATSGASGYIVYRATSSGGTYTRVKSVDTNKFVDDDKQKPLNESSTYYYKVRAFTQSGSSTTYSGYSSAVAGQTKAKPTFAIGLTPNSYPNIARLQFTMSNKGSKPLTVVSENSRLIDATDASYSRDLQLSNADWAAISTLSLEPGTEREILRFLANPASRYNQYSVIRYRFQYDGLWYICDANSSKPTWYADVSRNS